MFDAPVLRDKEQTRAIEEHLLTRWCQGDFVLGVGGFLYADNPQMLGSARGMTAEDILTSRWGDLDFLCY